MKMSRLSARILLAGAALSLPFSTTSCMNPALLAAQNRAHGSIAASGAGAQKHAKFQADQNRTVNQGTAGGALLGGIGGALLQRQLGPAGWLIGAAVGGLVGNQVGQGVAKKKADAQNIDSQYDGAIKSALAANKSARRSVDSLRSQLATLKSRANKAKASGDANEIKKVKDDLRALDGNYLAAIKVVDGNVSTGQKLAKQAGSGNKQYADVTSGVSSQQQLRKQAETDRREIASLLNSF